MIPINSSMSQADILSTAHYHTAVPSLILYAVVTFIILLSIGWFSTNNKQKFMSIFGLTLILSLIWLAVLIFIPNVTQFVYNLLFH